MSALAVLLTGRITTSFTAGLYAQMTTRSETLSSRAQERMATINQQASYASNLIQQILDFSRQTVLERRPLNLVMLLKEQVKIWERTLPENIKTSGGKQFLEIGFSN